MSHSGWKRFTAATLVLTAVALAVGCGDDDGGSGEGGGGPTIAFLLPENQTPRYEASDRPRFEEKIEEICPDCQILYSNATEDASKQQSQVEAALTQGADVLVLDPVDAASAAASVQKADQQGVPVLSYDRLILGAEVAVYVSSTTNAW